MRLQNTRAASVLIALTAAACAPRAPAPQSFGSAGPAASPPATEQLADATVVWQLSPFALLARGYFDGVETVGEVKRHGNLGLGAADQVDGEMALIDGVFYRFQPGGHVDTPPASMTMPFAAVTQWTGGTTVGLSSGLAFTPHNPTGECPRGPDTFAAAVDARLPSTNAFYALRLDGVWNVVVARTYLRQHKPYPPLSGVATDTITLHGVEGTMVGFRQPSYSDSLSVPNYHLHFVTRDRTLGGHVVCFSTRNVALRFSERRSFTLRMPPAAR